MTVNFYSLESESGRQRSSEDRVREFYERRRCTIYKTLPELASKFPDLREPLTDLKGKPDFFVVKASRRMSYRFVEVKGCTDGLKFDQVKWISKYHYRFPVDVVYLRQSMRRPLISIPNRELRVEKFVRDQVP